MQKTAGRTLKLFARTLPAFLALSFWGPAAIAADDPVLKLAVPQMDETPTSKSNKSASPLQAGVEHNVKHSSSVPPRRKQKKVESKVDYVDLFNGRYRSGAMQDGELSRFNLDSQRGIGIIGVRFLSMIGHQPVINTVFPGTPAAKVGVQAEDIIVAVDGVPTHGLTRDECYDLIVGTPNTPVTLSLRRNGTFFVRTMTRMDFLDIRDPRVQQAYKAGL